MCGILGYISGSGVGGGEFSEALEFLSSRGPDDEGYRCLETGKNFSGDDTLERFDYPSVFGHRSRKWFGARRLSITGGADCHQPMDYGDLTVIFEGEIYNYKDLKEELKRKGHLFETGGDTEVFLHAFDEWGLKSAIKMDGKWVAAVYNCEKNLVTCFRDHFGTKPLYYFDGGAGFGFSTQIKPLLKLKEGSPSENKEIALDYLNHALTDHTEETFFQELNQLRPGEYLRYQDGEIESRGRLRRRRRGEAGEVRKKVEESIMSKVPESEWCCTLSGGLDSSILATLLSDRCDKTFSLDIDNQKFEERKYRDQVLEENDLNGKEIKVSTLDLLEAIPESIEAQEEPTNMLPAQAQFLLFDKISDTDKKVVLTGSGADELFLGYPQFIPEAILESKREEGFISSIKLLVNHIQMLNYNILKYLFSLMMPDAWGTGKLQNSKYAKKSSEYFRKSLKPEDLSESREKQLKYHWYPSILRMTDKNAGNFGLETREGFLSQDLLSTVEQEKDLENFRSGETKKLLRDAFKDELPDEVVLRRNKTGFLPTNDNTYRPGVGKKFLELFKSSSFQNRELIKSRKALRDLKKGKLPFADAYRLYCYEIWKRKFIDG